MRFVIKYMKKYLGGIMKKIINLLSLLIIAVMLLTSCSGIMDTLNTPDYKQITNDIFTNYIEMNLIVTTRSESVNFVNFNQGSGVIYAKEGGYYYCLTNAHVVETVPTDKNVTYTVTDCYGNKYDAIYIHSDASRDLAVLRFSASESLCVVELAESDPQVDEEVVALAASNHLINSVTFGRVLEYKTTKIYDNDGKDVTRVTFPVIHHSAPVYSGSSGAAILNLDMKLVGVNYGGSTYREDGSFHCGFAVSVSHIREYLEENKLMK